MGLVDCSSFAPELREQARSWLAPIASSSELSDCIFQRLSQQSHEAAGVRYFDPRCLVAEAAFDYCHMKDKTHFFVGELAVAVNALLKGYHEGKSSSHLNGLGCYCGSLESAENGSPKDIRLCLRGACESASTR